MNKKQELVKMILDRMEDRGITLGEYNEGRRKKALRAEEDFWERYPDGNSHGRGLFCVEGQLSCLSVKSLEQIVEKDCMKMRMSFRDLWMAWGRAGYFKTDPELMYVDKRPILRMRHDCYLSPYGDAGFQNSKDAYMNGSNGANRGLGRTQLAIAMPKALWGTSPEAESDPMWSPRVARARWDEQWNVFQYAMYISYPALACGGISAFTRLIKNNPALFEQFMQVSLTDWFKTKLSGYPTLDSMRLAAESTKYQGPTIVEIPLIEGSEKDDQFHVYAILRFSETHVELTWSVKNQVQKYAFEFPKWDYENWAYEARHMDLACDSPNYLAQSDYLCDCWVHLAAALMMLAHIDCDAGWAGPAVEGKFDTTPLVFFERREAAKGLKEVEDILYDVSHTYPGHEELINTIPSMPV